jgi:hypothetical protein
MKTVLKTLCLALATASSTFACAAHDEPHETSAAALSSSVAGQTFVQTNAAAPERRLTYHFYEPTQFGTVVGIRVGSNATEYAGGWSETPSTEGDLQVAVFPPADLPVQIYGGYVYRDGVLEALAPNGSTAVDAHARFRAE